MGISRSFSIRHGDEFIAVVLFSFSLDIIPFSSKNSLSSCQGRKHPWVKEAFGQRPTAALQEVMDRCRCYLQAATSLWPLRLQGEVRGGDVQEARREACQDSSSSLPNVCSSPVCLARLSQPHRFCMRARVR